MLYRIDYSDGDWEEMTQLQLECNLVSRVCRLRAQEVARGSIARDSELWMERAVSPPPLLHRLTCHLQPPARCSCR